MSGEYSLADLADQDVLDIAVYVARFGVKAADKLIDRLDHAFQMLADFPGMGRRRDALREGLRSFPVNDYVIFNIEVDNGIRIIRVLHGRRDIDQEFR